MQKSYLVFDKGTQITYGGVLGHAHAAHTRGVAGNVVEVHVEGQTIHIPRVPFCVGSLTRKINEKEALIYI